MRIFAKPNKQFSNAKDMKRSYILLIALFSSFLLKADPYMFPDLGTPGMATYIEIVADHDDFYFFHDEDDGFFPNNNGDDVRVYPVSQNPQLVVGPVTTTWKGRLLTTTVFVGPDYPTANLTTEWDNPNQDAQITLRVQKGPNVIGEFDFHIVLPRPAWNGLTGTTFGAGGYGRMSPRNAMIVDSLDLNANTTYRFSTQDPDPGTPGNEAYLPVTLLSVGPIQGGSGTVIDVSAQGRDGGPGGGGGGGRYCDNSGNGDIGGAGFTGGGGGGLNNALGSDIGRDGGRGSGGNNSGRNGGQSLNGVGGGETMNFNYETAGGGTGHPFGTSGMGWQPGTQFLGGYGGGTGRQQNTDGGSASYRTRIETADGSGFVHGNNKLVPLAGGSGGASGNPQTIAGCSGSGGGGGGAIRVYAPYMSNVAFQANGANGGATDADGGAGSGGGVEINVKAQQGAISQVNAEANGGNVDGSPAGGDGYIRVNYESGQVGGIGKSEITSSDTVRFQPTDYVIDGYRNPVGNLYHYAYIAGEWVKVGEIIGPSQDFDWQLTGAFPNNQDYIFFSHVWSPRTIASAQTDYVWEPANLLSQSAWNMLVLDNVPDIVLVDTTVQWVNCIGAVLRDSFQIKNDGDADLIVDMEASDITASDGDFAIISPTGNAVIVPPRDSIWVVFTYTDDGSGESTKRFRFRVNSNDPDEQEAFILVNVERTVINVAFLDSDRSIISGDSLYLGEFCLGDLYQDSLFLQNNSAQFVELSDFSAESPLSIIPENQDLGIPGNSVKRFNYNINMNAPGLRENEIIFDIFECTDTLKVSYFVIENRLSFVDANQQDFGNQLVATTGERRITIRNTGNGTVDLQQNPNSGDPKYQFVRYEPAVTQLAPGEEVDLVFEFTPNVEGDIPPVQFTWDPDPSARFGCSLTMDFELQGVGTSYSVGFSNDIDFGLVYPCQSLDTVIQVWNYSDIPFDIVDQSSTADPIWSRLSPSGGLFFTNSEDIAYFSKAGQPQVTAANNTLQNGDTVNFEVRFLPDLSRNGVYESTLIIVTSADPNNPIEINIQADVDSLMFSETESDGLDDRILRLGVVPLNSSASGSIAIELDSELQRRISFEAADNPADPQIDVNFTNGITLNQTNPTTTIEVTVDANEYTGTVTTLPYILTFENQCGEEIDYQIEFEVIQADLSADNIDIDTINPCFQDTISITVRNDGLVGGDVDSLKIIGNDAWTGIVASNLVPKESARILPLGVPINAVDYLPGPFSETVRIYTLENGIKDSIDITISGVVSNGIDPLELTLDFGKVIVSGSSAPLSRSFAKLPGISARTENIQVLQKYPGVFSSDILSLANQPLTDDADYIITGLFAPDAVGEFIDTAYIEVVLENPECPTRLPVIFMGEGVPGATINLWVDDTELENIDPLTDEIEIPIMAQITDGIDTVVLNSISGIELSWNKTLFYPESVEGGDYSIIEQETGAPGEARAWDIKASLSTGAKTITSTPSKLLSLKGSPMLGNSERTDFEFDLNNVVLDPMGLVSSWESESGTMSIEICISDNKPRLMGYTAPLDINASIGAGILNISAIAPYQGDYRLQVLDVTGKVLFEEQWESSGEEVLRYDIPVETNATGVYLIRYSNGRNLIIKKILAGGR